MSGVTYYKLEQRYEGDRTKGCGLTSAEVDANFHFLRGFDIKDVTLSDDGILTFHRVNCDYDFVITNLPDIIQEITDNAIASSEKPFNLTGEYDETTGELTLKLNGAELVVPGFDKTDFDFKLYVGQGLEGDGTKEKPIRLSLSNATGYFAPVEGVFDGEKGEEYDGSMKRYISKERTSPYGLLYTYNEVKLLENYLSENDGEWRIPTAEDWENLLSNIQCDDKADALKDATFENGPDTAFRVLPIKIDDSIKYAYYWIATEPDCGEGYPSKVFVQGVPDVLEDGASISSPKSVRFVKNWNREKPSPDVQEICGQTYSTLKIGDLVWTVENSYFRNDEIVGKEPYGNGYVFENEEEYASASPWKYYINDVDTIYNTTSKKELPANSVVMIHEYNGKLDAEWVVVKNSDNTFELKNRNDITLGYVKDYVDTETQQLQQYIEEVEDNLFSVSAKTESNETEIANISENLQEISDAVVNHENRITSIENDYLKNSDKEELVSADSEISGKVSEISGKTRELSDKIRAISGNTSIIFDALSGTVADIDAAFSETWDKVITGVKVNGGNELPIEKSGDPSVIKNVVDIPMPFTSVKAGDRILTLSQDGTLASNFNAVYDSENKKIHFYGKTNSDTGEISEICPPIDASDFIKDGFLSGATVETIDGEKYIKMVFKNADGSVSDCSIKVTDFITQYVGDNTYITVDGNVVNFHPSVLDDVYEKKADFNAIVGTGYVDEGATITHKIDRIIAAIEQYITNENFSFTNGLEVSGLLNTLGTGYYNDPAHKSIAPGTTIIEVLTNILRKEMEPRTVLPSVKIEFEDSGEHMEGDNVSLDYKIELDPGKYTYDDGTSASTQMYVRSYVVTLYKYDESTPRGIPVSSMTSTSFVPTGTFTNVDLVPGSTYTLQISLTYDSDYMPTTSFGPGPEFERPEAKITANGNVVTGVSETFIEVYRPIRYSILLSDNDIAYDYAENTVEIGGKIDNITGVPNCVDIQIGVGAQAIVILFPRMENNQNTDIYSIDKILDLGTGLELKDTFYDNKWTTEIDGYKHSAYIYDPAIGLNKTAYRLRISKN